MTTQMKIAREEVFGPVLGAITFTNEDHAVRIANDVATGSAPHCGAATSRPHTAWRGRSRTGPVWINCYDADDITVPFGGLKQSGYGRDRSLHALDKYTELKTTWIDLS